MTDFNTFKGEHLNKGERVEGEALARLALSRLEGLLIDAPEADKPSLERFYTLLAQSLEAFDKNSDFFAKCAPILKELTKESAPGALDLSALLSESEHSAPILKSDAEIAIVARSASVFVAHFGKERHKTLCDMLWHFINKKGIDSVDVWKSVGLGRKRWSNLLNRYNEPSSQAPKLTLLQVAIGLRLDFDETNELLMHQCYRLTKDESDLVFIYYIMNRAPFDKEANHAQCAKREADAVRKLLEDLGLKTIPAIYE